MGIFDRFGFSAGGPPGEQKGPKISQEKPNLPEEKEARPETAATKGMMALMRIIEENGEWPETDSLVAEKGDWILRRQESDEFETLNSKSINLSKLPEAQDIISFIEAGSDEQLAAMHTLQTKTQGSKGDLPSLTFKLVGNKSIGSFDYTHHKLPVPDETSDRRSSYGPEYALFQQT